MRLILVHGAGGTAHGWDLQRLAFPSAVAPDLPGHGDAAAGVDRGLSASGPGRQQGRVRLSMRDEAEGQRAAGPPPRSGPPGGERPSHASSPRTAPPGYWRIEDYAEWLRAAGQAGGWFPAVLAGHSMGGAVALSYALSWPADLAGIVLIATGARLRVAPELLSMLATDYPAAVDTVVARSVDPGAAPGLARKLRETMLAVPADVTVGDFQACDVFDVMGRLEEIRTPALIVAGREDRMTPPRYAEYLHAHLPRARLVWISGAGHMVHLERPREVNEAIRGFLSELTAGADAPCTGRDTSAER
jgi:pimeloyl-ACP methyl ester carboxylesterase